MMLQPCAVNVSLLLTVLSDNITVAVIGRSCVGWFKHCHLVEVGVGSAGESSGGHLSKYNRVSQCHEMNL